MASGISAIHVKRQQGKMMVLAMGQTPRGQRYLKDLAVLKEEQLSDSNFKASLGIAINEIMAEDGSNSQ